MSVAAIILLGFVSSVQLVNAGLDSEVQSILQSRDDVSQGKIDLNGLILAAGVTDCVKPCVMGLTNATANTFDFDEISHDFEKICSRYQNATECVKKKKCDETDVYLIVTKGLKSSCVDKKFMIKMLEPCLKRHADKVLEGCDAESGFVSALNEVAQNEKVQELIEEGGNAMVLVKYLGPLCEASIKMLSCSQKGLNRFCPGAGSALVETVIAPFEYTAQKMSSMGGSLVSVAANQIPPQCRPFLDVQYMNTLKMFGALPKKPAAKQS